MERWRIILAAFTEDIARHPGWYALLGYAGAILAGEMIRERNRVRAMLVELERDMTERSDEIEDRMLRALVEEFEE